MAIPFIDLCSGIGGFHSGLVNTGHYRCVGHAEIDKNAEKAYNAIYGEEGGLNYGDLRTINPRELPHFDLLCGGFPCQSFSVAGRRLGFRDTRGTVFFEIARILAEKRPPFLLLENVLGLLSHDSGRTLNTIFSALVEMGYNLEWMVLNSKYFGVPQQRRRLYIVGYLDPRCAGKVFPLSGGNAKNLKQLIPGPQGQRVYETDGIACTQCAGSGGWGGKTGLYFIDMNADPVIGTTFSLLNLLCMIAFAYCVIKMFFANIKRGGILLIQMAVGSLYMFSVPRGYADGFNQWMKQIAALCLTAFLQTTLLFLGLITFPDNMLLGLGIMLAANEVPRIAQQFGLDSSVKVNMMSVVHATTTAVNLTRTVAKAAGK